MNKKSFIPMAERPEEKKRRVREEKNAKFFSWLIFWGLVCGIIFWIWLHILT
jgi:cytoskeletal protein RodZ